MCGHGAGGLLLVVGVSSVVMTSPMISIAIYFISAAIPSLLNAMKNSAFISYLYATMAFLLHLEVSLLGLGEGKQREN